jgi:hypothetical protein
MSSSSRRRRIAANRANAQKSQGPVTPEGKARSAANAPVRHALLHEALTLEHAPVTTTEHLTVHEMAIVRWRLQRAWAMEAALVDNQMDSMAPKLEESHQSTDEAMRAALAFRELTEQSPSLPILLRYEARLTRQFDRCLARLSNLRAQREKVSSPFEANPTNEQSTDADNAPQFRNAGPPPVAAASTPIAPPSPMDRFPRLTRPQDHDAAPGPATPLPRAA